MDGAAIGGVQGAGIWRPGWVARQAFLVVVVVASFGAAFAIARTRLTSGSRPSPAPTLPLPAPPLREVRIALPAMAGSLPNLARASTPAGARVQPGQAVVPLKVPYKPQTLTAGPTDKGGSSTSTTPSSQGSAGSVG